jgi:hypothetical protein
MNFFKYVLILVFISFSWSCKNTDEPIEITDEPTGIVSLKGTEWKLSGYVTVESGELIPEETSMWSDTNNTLVFDESGHGYGKTIFNSVEVLQLLGKPLIIIMTKVGDSDNGHLELFYEAALMVDSYQYEENQLKFFYNDKKNYLLYKPAEEMKIPRVPVPEEILDLARTNWQFVGLVDAETNVLTLSCPDDCSAEKNGCYKFGFFDGGGGVFLIHTAYVYLDFSREPVFYGNTFNQESLFSDQQKLLLDIACTVESCKYENNQLKLFCDNKKQYLLFYRIEQ